MGVGRPTSSLLLVPGGPDDCLRDLPDGRGHVQ